MGKDVSVCIVDLVDAGTPDEETPCVFAEEFREDNAIEIC